MKKSLIINLIMILCMMSLAFATVTINNVDFPDKIGTAYKGPGFVNSSIDNSNDILVKSKWYKNGVESQTDGYLRNGLTETNWLFDFPDDSIPSSGTAYFLDNYFIGVGNSVTDASKCPKIFAKDGALLYNMTELVGLDCRIPIWDNKLGVLWIGCGSGSKTLTKVEATDWEDNSTYTITHYNSTNTGSALFSTGTHYLTIFGDYLYVGQSNQGNLINASNTSQLIERFTTQGYSDMWYDESKDLIYVNDKDTLYVYDYKTDNKTQTISMPELTSLGATEIYPYMFGAGEDERLLLVDFVHDTIFVYNTSNFSQQLLNKTYSYNMHDYQYSRVTNDPNGLWFMQVANDYRSSWYFRGIDRDLDMVFLPGVGTSGSLGVNPENNEYFIIVRTSDAIYSYSLYKTLENNNIIYTEKYFLDTISSGDNLTLEVSVFDSVTGEVARQNVTADVYNYSLSLGYPIKKVIVQRDLNNKGKVNIYGTYSGDSIDSFNMTYEGTDNGVLNIPIIAGEFNTSINLTAGDYNLNFKYNDIVMDNNYEFGIGDVIIVHGQSNAANTDNGGGTESSPYRVYKTIKTESTSCTNSNYAASVMETSNRWAELAHQASIDQGVPVSLHNFAVGGASITTINETCHPYNMQTLNTLTGGENKVRGLYWYQGESDEGDSAESYYNELELYAQRWFNDANFINGNLFVPGQVLSTPVSPPSGNVRLAIQNAWYNILGIERGSIMYDIQLPPPGTNPHPYGDSKALFTQRNNRAALNAMYGLYTSPPILENVYLHNESTIILDFNKSNLEISDWRENSGSIPYGITINSLGLNSSNITSSVISDDLVIITFDTNTITDGVNMTLCDIELDCYNNPVIRESIGLVPAEIVWNMTITINQELSCDIDGGVWDIDTCTFPIETVQEKACNSISEQILGSFNFASISLIILAIVIILGLLMSAFGGNVDTSTIFATVTLLVFSALLFVFGVIIYGKLSGAIC